MTSTRRDGARAAKPTRSRLRRATAEPPRTARPGPTTLQARIRTLVRAIQENDERKIEEAILRLSASRRVFAPLGFAIGAFVMLFDGLRLLISNWR